MWYAVYDEATGALVSTGSSVADDATLKTKGYTKKELQTKPGKSEEWDPVTLDFVATTKPKPKIPMGEFIERFGVTERENIFGVIATGTSEQQKRLRAFIEYIRMLGYADPNDPYVVTIMGKLEEYGVIGAGRAEEILQ